MNEFGVRVEQGGIVLLVLGGYYAQQLRGHGGGTRRPVGNMTTSTPGCQLARPPDSTMANRYLFPSFPPPLFGVGFDYN